MTDLEKEAQAYVEGFDAWTRLGRLGQVPFDRARRMARVVSQVSRPVADEMIRRHTDAAQDFLLAGAVETTMAHRQSENADRARALSQRTGMTVSELQRIRAGGHDREIVEARAALYRM